MLGGKGRTKRAVGSMRGLKVPKRGLAKLRFTKALKGAMKTAKAVKAPARRVTSAQLGAAATRAAATRGGRPTPRRRSPFRRRASAQQRMALGAARGRPRVQAARRR